MNSHSLRCLLVRCNRRQADKAPVRCKIYKPVYKYVSRMNTTNSGGSFHLETEISVPGEPDIQVVKHHLQSLSVKRHVGANL